MEFCELCEKRNVKLARAANLRHVSLGKREKISLKTHVKSLIKHLVTMIYEKIRLLSDFRGSKVENINGRFYMFYSRP